jgi:MarR family transcriptional regulator, transcriptional regulator for hemolysin
MANEERPFRIGFLIHDVSRLRRTVINKALKPLGVTGSQWWVLANLSRHNDRGVIQTELAKVMDAGKVTLGSLIDRLEASGYIERQADPTDRRVKHVVMSAEGAKLLAEVQEIANQVDGEIMGGISPADVSRAESVLCKMKERLMAIDALPGTYSKVYQEE